LGIASSSSKLTPPKGEMYWFSMERLVFPEQGMASDPINSKEKWWKNGGNCFLKDVVSPPQDDRMAP